MNKQVIYSQIETAELSYTVKLRLQICLNLTPVSICLNFRLIVYELQIQVQQLKTF